jgi:hypothetical protein
VRFPFTFMGLMALAMGVWVLAYVATHSGMDAVAAAIAWVTAAACLGFGVYVLVRRMRHGPQH